MKPKWLGTGGAAIVLAALAVVAVKHHTGETGGAMTPHDEAGESGASILLSTRSDRQQELRGILAEKNPQLRTERLRQWAAGVEVDRIPSLLGSVPAEVRRALLVSWAERDLEDAMAWFGKRSLKGEEMYREEMITALRTLDADKVLASINAELPLEARSGWLGAYFKEWSLAEPAGAASKLLQLSENEKGNPREWNDLLSQTAARWIEADPLAATDWLKALPEGTAKSQAESQAAYRWTELNPAAASTYAATQNNPQLHQTVAAKWAEANPSAAIAWAAALCAARPESQALAQATAIWAQADPQAAAAYAASLPESESRKRVNGALATTWAFTDPEALGKWVGELPASPSRDSAVGALYGSLLPNAPGEAFQWAETISDETLRGDHLERAASEWLKNDPANARTAITRSSMDEETKRRVLAEPAP